MLGVPLSPPEAILISHRRELWSVEEGSGSGLTVLPRGRIWLVINETFPRGHCYLKTTWRLVAVVHSHAFSIRKAYELGRSPLSDGSDGSGVFRVVPRMIPGKHSLPFYFLGQIIRAVHISSFSYGLGLIFVDLQLDQILTLGGSSCTPRKNCIPFTFALLFL